MTTSSPTLEARFWDTVPAGWSERDCPGITEAFAAAGPAYNYREQRWMDSHDHLHIDPATTGPDWWRACGADAVTCGI